jgi:hypothetical protein
MEATKTKQGETAMFIVMIGSNVVFTHSNVSVALSYAEKDTRCVVREFVSGSKDFESCPIVGAMKYSW